MVSNRNDILFELLSDSTNNYRNFQHHEQLWIEVFLRALGLSLIWNAWRKLIRRPKTEQPKQALRKGRFIVLLTLTTHLIPMIGAGIIIGFNIRGYYIGSELSGAEIDNEIKLSGLQFTAKLHELMMQASLSLVVVAYLRHELVRGQGLPFGMIFGSVQFSSPTYLWSKEFAGTLKARFRSKFAKWSLAFLIIVGCVIFSTVGPSSAIAMRPRLDDWPAGGTYFYLNATKEQIWPSTLDASNTLPGLTRPWSVISDNIIPLWSMLDGQTGYPDTFNVPSAGSMRTLYTRQRIGVFRAPWTAATTQMSNLADALDNIGMLWINAAFQESIVSGRRYSSRFKFRNEVYWSIREVYRPMTQVACSSYRKITEDEITQGKFDVPVVSTFCPHSTPIGHSFKNISQVSAVIENYNSTNSSSPVLQFADLPTSDFGENSIGAFISFPPSWPGGQALVTCAVDARWEPAVVKGSRTKIKLVTGSSNIEDEYADR